MLEISIIIPIYNVEKYIKDCFESIVKQKNMFNVEIICIDDGSTDNSGKICDYYAKIDKRFKVFHQKNLGVAAARNVGLKIASGKYIAWVDPDDYLSKDWYQKINACIKKNIDVIFFDYLLINGKNVKKIRYNNYSGFIDKDTFLKELVLDRKIQSQFWSKVIKRKLFNNLKIPSDLKIFEDYAVMHYLIEKARSIYYLSDILYYYIVRKNSLINKTIKIEDNYIGYLIAKERYKYLIKKQLDISKIEYLLRASYVCVNFYQIEKYNEKQLDMFNICEKDIEDNFQYILKSKDATIALKIKAIACKLNILGFLLKIKNHIY